MATQTTNYKFTLPAGNDNYDVGDFNGNFIKIDAQMKANADAAETAGDTAANHTHGAITNDGKIGTAANKAVFTGEDGALKAGTLPIAAGGTDAVTADAARENLGAQKKRLTFVNTNVAASAWAADETYTDYPYRAAIPLTGVTAASFAEVAVTCRRGIRCICACVRNICRRYISVCQRRTRRGCDNTGYSNMGVMA